MPEWTADVIVVGYGGAGAMAAVSAQAAGAKVLVVEKAEEGGGSTHEASGTLRPAKDPARAAVHYATLSMGTTPLEVMETFAQGEAALPTRLTGLGATMVGFEFSRGAFPVRHEESAYPHVEGAEGLGDRVRVAGRMGQGGGEALWTLLAGHVAAAGIEVGLGLRGRRLLRGHVGGGDRVDAIEVVDRAGRVSVLTARTGIVLTCGGFSWNRQMTQNFLGAELAVLSPPGRATGDGIQMAAQVGAGLWHMNAVSCAFGYRFPGHDSAFYAQMPATGYFIVDRNGRRYCDESSLDTHGSLNVMGGWNPRTGAQDRLPSYVIFDEATRTAGTIFNRAAGYNRHFEWSPDNGAEIERGWISTASTAKGLAGQLGLPTDGLEATFADYDTAVTTGEDPFGRPPDQLGPVATPPFYGLPLWPALLNTQGGPVRNRHAQILDAYDEPIPGLFSAGELGSIWGQLYPGSGNVAEAVVFGDIAGRNAYHLAT